MTKDAALKLALEALEQLDGIDTETECVTIDVGDVMNTIKEALAQPEQEPVAEVKAKMTGGNVCIATVIHEIFSPHREPLRPGDKLYAAKLDEATPPLPVQEPVGVVQCVSISGYPMQDSRGVEWLCAVPVGSKLYTSPPQENT